MFSCFSIYRGVKFAIFPILREWLLAQRILQYRAYAQWLKWSREVGGGGSPDETKLEKNPLPIPHQLIWRYLGIKTTLYRFNQGEIILLQGAQIGAGGWAPWPPHFNHCIRVIYYWIWMYIYWRNLHSRDVSNLYSFQLQLLTAINQLLHNWYHFVPAPNILTYKVMLLSGNLYWANIWLFHTPKAVWDFPLTSHTVIFSDR